MGNNRQYYYRKEEYILTKFLLIVLLVFVIAGCTSQKEHKETNITEIPDYGKKQAMGIDLFASGNEPYWSLELDTEDSVNIYILGGNNIRLKVLSTGLDTANKTIVYMFDNGSNLLIKGGACTNSMSGEKNDYSAKLYHVGKQYTGCGRFLIATKNPLLSRETLRLNDIWALKSMNGKEIDRKDFPEGIPILELHLNDGRFYGNTNCNEISGSIEVSNSNIYFRNFAQTKKFCEGDFETKYISALKIVTSWELDKMRLSLRSKGNEVLNYIKID